MVIELITERKAHIKIEKVKKVRKLFLTFDVEDFVNAKSINVLYAILKMLKDYGFKALFFITGHMAEKLYNFPQILDLLENHEIGYHSSSHSTRPLIFEYTDVANYKEAYLTSIKRETSHINPITGEIEKEGGIHFLRDLFPRKKIVSYRAPGYSWSPPHLDALISLGIKYDFSTLVSRWSGMSVHYNDVTFYPIPKIHNWTGDKVDYKRVLSSILQKRITVLNMHPNFFANQDWWASIYYKSNPHKLVGTPPRNLETSKSMLQKLELFIKRIKVLQRLNLMKVSTNLRKSKRNLNVTKSDIQKIYEISAVWPTRLYGFNPKFQRFHFLKYFDANR